MPSISSYFNPLSSDHHSFKTLNNLSGDFAGLKKFTAWTVAIITGAFTFGFGGVAVFRVLVGRFSKDAPTKQNSKVTEHIETLGQEHLNTPAAHAGNVKEIESLCDYYGRDIYKNADDVMNTISSAQKHNNQELPSTLEFVLDPCHFPLGELLIAFEKEGESVTDDDWNQVLSYLEKNKNIVRFAVQAKYEEKVDELMKNPPPLGMYTKKAH